MAYKISFINQKGGVGKTSLTLHSSGALAELGKRVLVIDLDPQGNLSADFFDDIYELPLTLADILSEESVEISKVIQKTAFENIDIVPANKKLRGLEARLAGLEDSQYYLLEELEEIEDQYDFILMDCPTGLGKPTRIAVVASDYTIVPLQCLGEAVDGSAQVVAYLKEVQKRANPGLKLMGFVINKFDGKRAIEQSFREVLREQYNESMFQTEFKRSVKFAEATTTGKPITAYVPNSPEADTAREFVQEILKHVEKR